MPMPSFFDLFSTGPGRVAPTQASLEECFPILEELINSDSKDKRLLALDACKKALKTRHSSRMVGPEYQGLKVIKLWEPKNPKEILNYYKKVCNLVNSKLDTFSKMSKKRQ